MGRDGVVRLEDGVTCGSIGEMMTRSGDPQGALSSEPSAPLSRVVALAASIVFLLVLSLAAVAQPLLAEEPDRASSAPHIARGLRQQAAPGAPVQDPGATSAVDQRAVLAGATPSVIVSPTARLVQPGHVTTVDVTVLDVSNLYGIEVRISFDPTILQVVDDDPIASGVQIALGPFLGCDVPSTCAIVRNEADNVGGTLAIAMSKAAPPPPDPAPPASNGSGVLAAITFEAVAIGTSPVSIGSARLTEPSGFLITPVGIGHGQVAVTLGGTIQGAVYHDLSGNGARDVGEPGLDGVRIRLIAPGTDGFFGTGDEITVIGTTLPDGSYSFDAATGQYKLYEHDPTGYGSTTPNTVVVSVGLGDTVVVDFGDQLALVLVGKVTFQGRSVPPAPDWVCPISMTLTPSGQTAPAYTLGAETDEHGTFTVTHPVSTGTYDVAVRDLHSLWNVRLDVAIGAGVIEFDAGRLVEGDANRDGKIDVVDLGMLAAAYGPGEPYDRDVDFNNDLTIGVGDLALLAANYGREGKVTLSGLLRSR